jgi:superfamily II DNA or RNA helicase
VGRALELLGESGSGPFRASVRGATLVSAYVPAALRKWIDAATAMGASLAFPPEAIPKLAAVAQPLLAAGVAEMPKEALGSELPYEPRAALRVEWRTDGAAVVDALVSVHPRAPLVAPGEGPSLFTFEDIEGSASEARVTGALRVFVERAPKGERAIVAAALEEIDAPLTWQEGVGRTETFEDAIAVAAWLEQNPLGLRIEVKIGRPPVVTPLTSAARLFRVDREGAWLVLDGALDVAGTRLTLGAILEAARLAHRYVKVTEGTFLELSAEAKEKLHALAIAADLAGAPAGDGARVHEAFAGAVADAAPLLGSPRAADFREIAARLERRKARVRVPPLERGELRPYQKEGAAWMLRLATWAPGCVLADDMGLGKTVQTASVLKARRTIGPALVVAPASVTSNWLAELARFMPSLAVRWYNEEKALDPEALGGGDVLVVSYGILQRRAEILARRRWATVVLDEAQYVKNVAAQRTDAVRGLARDFTIALTGTPLENHLGELFSIVDLAFPGLLGDEGAFRDRFRRPIEGGKDAARLAVLGRLIAPFLLRRTRAAVLDELPPREEITEYVDLSPEETKRYLALRRACENQFAGREKGLPPAHLRIELLAALTRLRQLACDVRLVDPTFEGSSTKIARAVERAKELAAEGNRALVFSQFTQFLEKVRSALADAGLRVGFLSGDTPTTKRRPLIDAFQRGELDVFCVSLLAGGTGLNLTRASYVLHLDPWWNPAAEEQATSRAHRMGQSSPVTVYRLVSRGTIEEAVLGMQADKRELASAVLDGKGNPRAFGADELLHLLRFGGGEL